MNSRHIVLIVLTGVGLIVFAPMSGNKEPARLAEVADKPTARPSPPVQKVKVVPKVKVVLLPEHKGTPQSPND